MKFLRLHWGLALAASVFATAAGAQQYGYDNQRYSSYNDTALVRCESQDERTRYCAADIRGDVRLVNQLSRSNCIEGRSWGWNNRGVWVANGCRAQFQIGGRGYDDRYGNDDRNRNYPYRDERDDYRYGDSYARRVTCESHDNHYNFCGVGGSIRQAQVHRQMSQTQCRYNYSWGYRGDGIWVDRGCRAEFTVY